MHKIASPNQLAQELQRLLAYAQTRHPSRIRLARELAALGRRVAAESPKAALDAVERKLKSKFRDLSFTRDEESDLYYVLTIEPGDRDIDSSVVVVSVDQEGDSSSVSVHHYGSGHSSSEGPDFDDVNVGKLESAAARLIKKYLA